MFNMAENVNGLMAATCKAQSLVASASDDRRGYIGGSDIGKIIGASEYGDEFSLYLEKTGELEPPAIETKVQRRGKILEPAIIEMYRYDTGAEVVSGATVPLSQASHYRAQIDAMEQISPIANDAHGRIPLEIKSASEFTRGKWGQSGTDDAPTSYCAQLHWQMLAMDAPFGRIVALLGADDLRVYTIERDPKVDEFLLERAAEFWSRVQERRPPTINFEHPSTGETLARLFNKPVPTEILQADVSMRAWRDVLLEASEKVKQYEAVRDGAKAHLLSLMGNAAIINFGEQMYERKFVKRKGYTVADCTYIDARLKSSRANKAGVPALTEEVAA